MGLILSIVEIAARVNLNITFTALVKRVVSRMTKERTAPISGRDGSDNADIR
jgi:hypothetical protein